MEINLSISVVVPTYNAAPFIEKALQSVFAQTHAPLEIIVVNDGSVDATNDICTPLQKQGKIQYIVTENRGPNAARNLGVAKSSGDLVAFLDADDLWDQDKLSRQLSVFSDYPDTGMVFCDFSTFDSSGIIAYSKTNSLFNNLEPQKYDYLFSRNNFIFPSTVIIKKEVFENCGLFLEQIRGAEDYEFWLRIVQKYPIRGIQEPLALLREHAANSSKNIDLMHEHELKVITLQKHLVSSHSFRKRIAQIHFLAADRYVATNNRRNCFSYIVQGIRSARWLPVNILVIVIRFVFGQKIVTKVRRFLNSSFWLRSLFEKIFKHV